MILATRILGKTSFGEFSLVQATLGVFGIMAGVGLGSTATRFVAQFARVDPARAGRVIGLVNSSSILTVLVATVALVALSDVLSSHVMDAPHLGDAIVWGSLLLAANALRGIQNGILAGLERFDAIANLNVLDGLLSLPAIVIFASLMGVEGALLGLAISAFCVWIVGRFLVSKSLQKFDIEVTFVGVWSDRKILTQYSLPSFLASSIATPVLWVAMAMVARTQDGFAQLGIYNAAYQWHGPLVFLPIILMSVSMPVLVQEWEGGHSHRFRRLFLAMSGIAGAVTLSGSLVLSLISPWIMSLYGADFSEGWMVLVILLMAAPFHAIAKISTGALLGMNKAWWVLISNFGWGGTLLIGTILMIESLGILGLAAAFIIAYVVLASLTSSFVLFHSRTENVT
jgi:O-antigen/teichoic acid export membrane protein